MRNLLRIWATLTAIALIVHFALTPSLAVAAAYVLLSMTAIVWFEHRARVRLARAAGITNKLKIAMVEFAVDGIELPPEVEREYIVAHRTGMWLFFGTAGVAAVMIATQVTAAAGIATSNCRCLVGDVHILLENRVLAISKLLKNYGNSREGARRCPKPARDEVCLGEERLIVFKRKIHRETTAAGLRETVRYFGETAGDEVGHRGDVFFPTIALIKAGGPDAKFSHLVRDVVTGKTRQQPRDVIFLSGAAEEVIFVGNPVHVLAGMRKASDQARDHMSQSQRRFELGFLPLRSEIC